MGNLEKKVRMNEKKKCLLHSIKSFGKLSITFPLTLHKILDAYDLDKIKTKSKYSFWRTVTRLEYDGLIQIETKNQLKIIKLSKRGEKVLYFSGEANVNKGIKHKWDKKWRVLIFDIPEERKGTRNKVRNTLRSRGFFRLQDSVWIYPHDIEDFVTLLKTDLKVGREVLYMIVDVLENDHLIKKHFSLS